MSLGAFLKSERKLRNLTQEDIASAVGVVSPVVSKWENDKSVPDLPALCLLCNLLELSIEEIAQQCRFTDGRQGVLPPKVYDATAVGKTLRELRIKNGLSQSEAGQKLYVTSQTVSKWEGGAVTLLETLVKLSEFYGVSPSVVLSGLGPTENVATDAQKRTVAWYKHSFWIMTVVLAIVLIATSVGGIFVGQYVSKLRSEIGNGAGNTTNPESPFKEYCKLTVHAPDGTTEEYQLKFGERTEITFQYKGADIEFLRYNEKTDGTGSYWGGAGGTFQLFYDTELYPIYPFGHWVDFFSAKDDVERAHYYTIEHTMQEFEQMLCKSWFGNWRSSMFGESSYHSWQPGAEILQMDKQIGSGHDHTGAEYGIYESRISDNMAQVFDILRDEPAFAKYKDKFPSFMQIQSELNYAFQDFEYYDPDYDTKTDEEKKASNIAAYDAILNKFLIKIVTMAEKFYGDLDKEALWETDLLRDFKNDDIWGKAPTLAEKYNLPAAT